MIYLLSWVSEDQIETFRGLATVGNFRDYMISQDVCPLTLEVQEVWEPDESWIGEQFAPWETESLNDLQFRAADRQVQGIEVGGNCTG